MYIKPLNSLMRSLQKNKAARLRYLPTKISFETGNICNLKCPLCPTNDEEEKGVEKGFMSFKTFKAVFDKVSPFVKTIDLFNWGEPFLNKDISGMIEYARKKKPDVRIFIDSNLNVLSDDQVDSFVRYGLDVLKVSCDGATQEIYEKYRVGGDLDTVISNIKRIQKKKDELGFEKPRIIWKYLVFNHNQHEVSEAGRKAAELDISFEASGMRVNCGKEIFENVEASVDRDREWIPDSSEYNNYQDLNAGKKTCVKPWRTLTVNWNGDVVPCGAVYDCKNNSFGNLEKESFMKVWNSPSFIASRKCILGKVDEAEVICSVCKKNGYQFF